VDRIRDGDETGVESLYAWLNCGVRAGLYRRLGTQPVDDRLHEILVVVLEAIRSGDLREPERLGAFVSTVARRSVAAEIRIAINRRRRMVDSATCIVSAPASLSPEARAADREQSATILSMLRGLKPRDRELLTRFYLQEETPLEICQGMHISPTQFRLWKSRAIAKCYASARRNRTQPKLQSTKWF
jgi:RNA polymerase sigma factor (sigma-70 family)